MLVVLDTNILIADPQRRKSAFVALNNLASKRQISIVVPELVEREFLSRRTQEHANRSQSILGSISELQRLSLPPREQQEAIELLHRAEKLMAVALQQEYGQFAAWKTLHFVISIPTTTASIEWIMERYFSGTPPFKSVRDQKAFLDAAIISSLEGLLKGQSETVCVVSNDEFFRRGLPQHALSFELLDDLVESSEFQDQLAGVSKRETATVALIVRELPWCISVIERFVAEEILDLADEAYDYDFEEPYTWHFSGVRLRPTLETPVFLGDGTFSLRMSGVVTLTTSAEFDLANKTEIFDHLDNGYHEQSVDDYHIHLARNDDHSFETTAIVKFDPDYLSSGGVQKNGVFLSVERSEAFVEDTTFQVGPDWSSE